MVGTLLKDDLQSSIEDQLQQYARGLGQTVSGAGQEVGDTLEDLQRAGRTTVQDIQSQLSDYATQAFNASLEAQRQAQEQAAQRAQQAAQVQQQLTDYAAQASQAPQPVAGAPQATPAAQPPLPAGAPAPATAPPPTPEPTTGVDPNTVLDRNGVVAYVQRKAKEFGLDPAAVLAVANQEGLNTEPGSHWQLPGERNISFGPPSWYGNGAGADILAQHGEDAARWSWTPPGIDYWLNQVSQAAKGLVGNEAVAAIVHGFERPREDLAAGEIARAQKQYANFVGEGGPITTAAQTALGAAGAVASTAANAIPGVAGARRVAGDVMQAGEAVQAAKPVIYGTLAGAQPDAMQQLGAIQDQLDSLRQQLAGAPEAARRTVQQATEPLVAGAQQAVGGAFNALGTGVAGALGTDEASMAARRQRVEEAMAGAPARPQEPSILERPMGLGDIPGAALGALNAFAGGTVTSPAQRQAAVTETQRQFAAVSPTTVWGPDVHLPWDPPDAPPTHLTGGLIQQLVDPLIANPIMLAPGGLLFDATNAVGTDIVQAIAPQLGTRAAGYTASAINNGVQNAIFEAGQPDATPQSVGTQFLIGLGVGPVMHGLTSELPSWIGRQLARNLPDLAQLVRTRQRGEAEVGFAAGVPTRGGPLEDVLHGMAVPRAGYEPGTPEHTVETFLQDQARAQGTPRPQVTGADIAGLPGMEGSRMKGLQEVRDAIEAGLPAARWYQQMVEQIRQDTGQDINPREAAVLMGAFGGNAGVAPNYHAMLSVFDAIRQANPDLSGLERMDVPQIQATPAYKAVEALVSQDKAYADRDMLARVLRGYRTGEIPVPSGAKLSSYTQDFLHALNELYSPYSTQDVWQGRIFGARPDAGVPDFVASRDAAYRTMHALTNWVAREMHLPPDAAQAAGWAVFRQLWNDPRIGPELRADRIGLSDAIRLGQQSGVLNPYALATGGLAEVTASRTGVPTAWADKINDVRDRIRTNGSYNASPPASATAINEMALYHPSVQNAAQARELGYGKVVGAQATRPPRPVGSEQAAALRDLALGDQPVLRVPSEVQVDPRTGRIPWLLPEHTVQRSGDRTYVMVTGVGDDAAHLIGQRLGADRFNHADPTSLSAGGIKVEGIASRADQARVADALQARGLPVIREQAGTGLRVPLVEGRVAQLARRVQQTLADEAVQGKLQSYTGTTHAVESTGQGRAGGAGDLRGGAAGRLGVQAGDRLLGHPLAASVFRDAQLPTRAGPPVGRARGQATVPFATNLAGAAFGGYAGNLATPEGATPEERARNIAAGAAAGFGGTHLLTRGLLRGAETAPARAAEGFRAPGRPETPELRATTQEPPGGPVRPAGPEPRTLGEVHSNPYALREAVQGETPMSPDEMLSYADELEQRMSDVQARRDAVDEMLRNPNQKVERPPWAGGLTNLQVAEVARRQAISPYEPLWWETAGLEAGSGEVREALREGGAFREGLQQRELSPAELRAERARLDTEAQDISTAYDQMTNAPAEPNLVRVRSAAEAARATAPEALPFDTGAPPEPTAAPVTEAGGGLDEGARLAQEIVLSKGRGTLRSDEGTVSLERGDVRSTALVSHEAIQEATATPPSARTAANMPNLDAMLKGEPEIAAQIRQAAEDNPELFEAYRQGRISMDSLRNDLAKRVGMTVQDWNKTKIGQAFNPQEMVALQAAAVEQQGRMMDTATSIVAKGGVDALTPEELVFSAATLADAVKILAVARGGRTTAGRTLNALKQRFDRTMASDITAANERKAAQQVAAQARRAAARATTVLVKGRQMEREATQARASASRQGAPRNILQQIDDAYAQLDRYNAMTLHEKGAEFDRLKAERAKRAEARKAAVRGAPEELLSALRRELKAEQDNFAKRKDRWETMAFWDSKAAENAIQKRTAFRGQLYIEQQRKLANIAAKDAEKEQSRAFDAELKRKTNQREKAQKLLESIGGQEVTRQLLDSFVKAMADPAPDAAAKFLKGMAKPSNWARATTIRLAGLLSGPLTHMANGSGNVARAIVEVPVRATTVGIDALRAAVTGGERQAYRAELLPMLQAYAPGFYAQLPEALRILKTGVSQRDIADLSKIRAGFGSGNAAVDAAVEMPLRLLQAEDAFFRGAAYAAHAQRVTMREAIKEGFTGEAAKGRAATILKNLEEYPDLAKEVEDAAAHMVFQERRNVPVPRMLPGTKAAQSEMGRFAVSQVAPFIQTPANITAQGAGLSPLGFTSALEAARGVREMPTGTRAERYARGRQVLLAEERAARAIVGTGILGAGIALGSAGMLTGAYSEDPAINSTYPQGWRPWSLRIGDPVTRNTYYIPLQNFSVAGAPLAIAAILTDPTHHGKTVMDPEEFGMAVAGLGKYVLDNTFLQGMSDFVDMLQDPNRRGSQFFESLAASYGPYSAMGREIQRSMGTATRNPREGIRGLIDAMEANYPGLSGTVPPSLTPLGEERTQGATGAGRLVPLRYDIERDEPTLQILRSTGVGVPQTPRQLNVVGGHIDLTEDERAALQQARGEAIRDVVARVSASPQYQRADAGLRAQMLQENVQFATRNANDRFLNTIRNDIPTRRKAKEVPEPYYLGGAA